MKRFWFLAFLAALSGCTHRYVLTLTNGSRITSTSKPHADRGYYVCKDANGKTFYVAQGRVREVAPASMAGEEREAFKPSVK